MSKCIEKCMCNVLIHYLSKYRSMMKSVRNIICMVINDSISGLCETDSLCVM